VLFRSFDVVAEGIETERQRDFLAELNCEFGQGYLFSRPLTEDKALDLLAICCPKPPAGS
jgi:EAL domain-containing protein (putative c-di-GMP-specific phosphodiesterase class I)